MAELPLTDFFRPIPDWPIPGVVYQDIRPLLANPSAFKRVIDLLVRWCYRHETHFTAIAAIESRGWLFGMPLAMELDLPFIPIRKQGKSPPPVKTFGALNEYGLSELEVAPNQDTTGPVLVVDDILATGQTAQAAFMLLADSGYDPKAFACIAHIKGLGGPKQLNFTHIFSAIGELG